MSTIALPFLLPALLLGCAEASREVQSKSYAATARADNGGTNTDLTAALEQEEPGLRRTYTSADMKTHACMHKQDDGSLVGTKCPPSIVVFGPYVVVPSNADVRLQFDIESSTPLKLNSDVLSNGAKQFHAALEDQTVLANQRGTVRHRVHLFDSARALETRIGIRATEPADFTISNLEVVVE